MEKINFKKQNIPFTQVANGVLNDKKLSFFAKGLYAYLYSKPDGWNFSSSRIALESSNGRDAVRNGLNELFENGYLLRYKLPNGRMIYKVIFPPVNPEPENPSLGKNPEPEKATDGKSHSGIISPISNKEVIVINSNSNKYSEQGSQGVNEVIKAFENVDAKNKTYYGNKTQRKSADFLVSEYGLEKVLKVIAILPKSNNMDFCPVITSPNDLKEKWEKLATSLQKIKNKQPVIL